MSLEYLTLGRGRLLFAPFLADGVTPGGFIEFGNCPNFGLNVTFEDLPHYSSQGGVKEEDANAMLSRDVTANITCDHLKPENLAYFFLGEVSGVEQTSGTATTYTITGVQQGRTYRIGSTLVNPFGVVGVSAVSTDVGVAGTDYTLNAAQGTITIIEGGAITEGSDLVVTFDTGALSSRRVQSGNVQAEGALLFLADNPEGVNQDVYMPYTKIRPEGDLNLITDEWAEMGFSLKALKPAGQQMLYMQSAVPA